MKRINNIVFLLFAVSAISSCDFLAFDESIGKTRDEVYESFTYQEQIVSHIYTYLPQDLGAIGGAMRESATDNAVYVWNTSAVYKMYEGKWSATVTVDDVWPNMYAAIHAANSFLENYDEDLLKRLSLNEDYADQLEKYRRYPYEVRTLRALFYFELAKRYGDVPLVKATLEQDEVNKQTRASFDEVIKFVVDECSETAEVLPVSYQKLVYQETGRVTKGMALALKSRALLYAASPLHNPENNVNAWKEAAAAAHEVIALGCYSLPDIDSDPLYHKDGANEVFKSSQLIFERRNNDSDSYERYNLPIGFEGGRSGNTPTQSLVDAFEMADGTLFDWNNPVHKQNPYQNRDPRFYKTIVYHGSKLMNTTVDVSYGGRNGLPQEGATQTGYYVRKYINETVSLKPDNPKRKAHHYILFRYAEILLNYAEAVANWLGADVVPDGMTLTARQALNMVRTAAKMPGVTAVGDEFLERVLNERRVELAFEDHRFWDIRRLKIGHVVENVDGVKLLGTGEYERVDNVRTRVWEDKMYFYPVSKSEYTKNPNLGQNPGW